jgi:2-phosphosulfolactate phosphatase
MKTPEATCNLEWGPRGVAEAAHRGDAIVIVDVLSFSTTTAMAISHGAKIFPYPYQSRGEHYAARIGATMILGRAESIAVGRPTLSPESFNETNSQGRFVLCSKNGGTCARIGRKAPLLMAGAFVNCSAVAAKLNESIDAGLGVTAVACGERWNATRGMGEEIRFCLEDYLGCGAILARLKGKPSPGATVCLEAYRAVQERVAELVRDSESGRELRERGYAGDVEAALKFDAVTTAAVYRDSCFQA